MGVKLAVWRHRWTSFCVHLVKQIICTACIHRLSFENCKEDLRFLSWQWIPFWAIIPRQWWGSSTIMEIWTPATTRKWTFFRTRHKDRRLQYMKFLDLTQLLADRIRAPTFWTIWGYAPLTLCTLRVLTVGEWTRHTVQSPSIRTITGKFHSPRITLFVHGGLTLSIRQHLTVSLNPSPIMSTGVRKLRHTDSKLRQRKVSVK